MANLSLVTSGKLRIVESIIQMTLPAAETLVAGASARLDTTTGKFTNSNGTTNAEGRAYGVVVRNAAAGEPVTVVNLGVVDGYDLSGLNYDAAVYLSDTDGTLADSAGTVGIQIGRVIPATSTTLGTAFDKVLAIDFGAAANAVATDGARTVVTSELLAASVDKWVFVADRAYKVMGINEVHSVVGGSSAAVRPRKVTAAGTDAPGAAAGTTVKELTTANIDLTATINVVQAPALAATAADLLLAAGDKIGLDFSGTLTGLVGSISIALKAV
jgi:hypothetical protein